MKQKILIFLSLLTLGLFYPFSLHSESNLEESLTIPLESDSLTPEDLGLTPSNEDDFLSDTEDVLKAISKLQAYNAFLNNQGKPSITDFSQYRMKLKQVAGWLRSNYPDLPFAQKLTLIINADRMSVPVHETGVSQIRNDINLTAPEDNIETQIEIVNDYLNEYNDTIDNICLYCNCCEPY